MKIDYMYFHIFKPNILPVGVKYEEFKNIDNYENDSIENITIQDLLDYVEDQHTGPTIKLFVDKLKTDGTLTIQGTDLLQLSSSIVFKEIELSATKKIIYNGYKKSIHTMNDIVELLQKLDVIIEVKKYINIFEYYIVVRKNEKN
jgi:hypothetical protein